MIAWVGLISAFPAYHVSILVWRVATVVTLGAYLWVDRRTPAGLGEDTRLANGFGVLGVLLTAWFGVWFVPNDPSYPMFAFLLLMLAFLLHPPSRWMPVAYVLAAPVSVSLCGALLYGTPPRVVVEWVAPYAISVVLVMMVDRVLYQRMYQGFEAERLLGRANDELGATVAELQRTQSRLVEAERQAERARITRDLHGSVGGQLSSLLAGVELARLERQSDGEVGPTVTLDEVEADAREALQQLRETV